MIENSWYVPCCFVPRNKYTFSAASIPGACITIWKSHHVVKMTKDEMSFLSMLAEWLAVGIKHLAFKSIRYIAGLAKAHFLHPTPIK
jgi:ribonuclease HIII